jgi:hypothetical protein
LKTTATHPAPATFSLVNIDLLHGDRYRQHPMGSSSVTTASRVAHRPGFRSRVRVDGACINVADWPWI